MSTYYDFMVEARYDGKWYNIDFYTKDIDGKMRHQYLATVSRSFLGNLDTLVDGAWTLGFDELAEGTQKILLEQTAAEAEDSLRLEQFYVAGSLADFEKLLNNPYQMEYYVTRNQIAAYESHSFLFGVLIPQLDPIAKARGLRCILVTLPLPSYWGVAKR